jgi:hypothetical protein
MFIFIFMLMFINYQFNSSLSFLQGYIIFHLSLLLLPYFYAYLNIDCSLLLLVYIIYIAHHNDTNLSIYTNGEYF